MTEKGREMNDRGRVNPYNQAGKKEASLFATCPLLLFILLFILHPGYAYSQTKLRFDIFSQEDGLPSNQVQCIYQDSKGWMWIGTSQGLSRFDGYKFVNFLPDPNDSSSIRGNLVRVIKEDNKGNLLIGTETGGLNIFDRRKETFSHPFMDLPHPALQDISVNDIVTDKNGSYWIATDLNVMIMDTLGTLKVIDAVTEHGNAFNAHAECKS